MMDDFNLLQPIGQQCLHFPWIWPGFGHRWCNPSPRGHASDSLWVLLLCRTEIVLSIVSCCTKLVNIADLVWLENQIIQNKNKKEKSYWDHKIERLLINSDVKLKMSSDLCKILVLLPLSWWFFIFYINMLEMSIIFKINTNILKPQSYLWSLTPPNLIMSSY